MWSVEENARKEVTESRVASQQPTEVNYFHSKSAGIISFCTNRMDYMIFIPEPQLNRCRKAKLLETTRNEAISTFYFLYYWDSSIWHQQLIENIQHSAQKQSNAWSNGEAQYDNTMLPVAIQPCSCQFAIFLIMWKLLKTSHAAFKPNSRMICIIHTESAHIGWHCINLSTNY